MKTLFEEIAGSAEAAGQRIGDALGGGVQRGRDELLAFRDDFEALAPEQQAALRQAGFDGEAPPATEDARLELMPPSSSGGLALLGTGGAQGAGGAAEEDGVTPLREGLQEIGDLAERTGDRLGDALSRGIEDGKLELDDFRSILADAGGDLASLLLQTGTQAGFEALFGPAQAGPAGGGGGGGFGSLLSGFLETGVGALLGGIGGGGAAGAGAGGGGTSTAINQAFYISAPNPGAFRASQRQIGENALGSLAGRGLY